jgi:hypothetical protein
MALRAAAGLDGKDGTTRYHRALDELQRKLLVMPIGATNEVGNWPSQIFELVARLFPAQAQRARELDARDARRTLVTRYLQTVVAAPLTSIARLFGIPRSELDPLLDELIADRRAQVEGEWVIVKRKT